MKQSRFISTWDVLKACQCRRRARRSGIALIYMMVIMTLMIGFCSLAVDLGRVQLSKTQVARTADAVARYAVQGLVDDTYVAKAIAVAAQNSVDGSPVVLTANDIETGTWYANSRTFSAGGYGANAVRVSIKRTAANGNPIPLVFGKTLGVSSCDVTVSAIASITYQTPTTYVAPAKGDPWLAGMPDGTTGNWYDMAPNNSPTKSPVTLTPNTGLQFNFAGNASYYPGTNPFSADGSSAWIINNYAGSEHGMANLNAPIASVVAVFLDDSQPDSSPPPAGLDFSSAASRDFATLSPGLKQPFFIGDGLRDDKVTPQNFIVPAGATRLYIGIMDGQQWSDNAGGYTCTVAKSPMIKIVK